MTMADVLVALDVSEVSVLAGAGVTRAAGGPTAQELLSAIAEELISEPSWRQWVAQHVQPSGELRFETAMEELGSTADPDLTVLQLFNGVPPGPLHAALARAAARGARLMTVNFDDLLEQAVGGEGLPAWTVDLQQGAHLAQLDEPGAVAKLHGTLHLHRGPQGVQAATAPLQATISEIVTAGGGAGLRPDVEQRMHGLIDGRDLLVVGYSGSDDLDVMPSLGRARPRRAVWVMHEGDLPHSAPLADAGSPAVRSLLEQWQRQGAEVTLVRGRTDEALTALGVPVPPPSNDLSLAAAAWRRSLQAWAPAARDNDPSGLGWVAEMAGSLGRFGDAARALAESTPSTQPDGLWSPHRRLLQLAENALLRDESPSRVRELADQARQAAVRAGDPEVVAGAYLLVARTHLAGADEDFDAAEAALAAGMGELDPQRFPGSVANLELWTARSLLLRGAYGEAAGSAARAAADFRRVGAWPHVSEARQVEGQARGLDGDDDEARDALAEALHIAETGPYPERQIAAHAVLASLADATDDLEQVLVHARAAIDSAVRTGHVGELAQSYAMLGLALSEQGDFDAAAAAFESGLTAIVPATDSLRGLLACGLADSLLHLGRLAQAVQVLDENGTGSDDDPRHRLHAAAIRWRAGTASRDDVLAAAAQLAGDQEPEGQTALAVLRLEIPGPHAAAFVARARDLIVNGDQQERRRRFDAAAQRGWPRPSSLPAS